MLVGLVQINVTFHERQLSYLTMIIFVGIIRKRKRHECSKEKLKKMRKKQQPKNGKNGQFNKTGKFTVMASIQPIYVDVLP